MGTIKFEAQQGAGGGGGGGVEQEYVDAHDALTLQASKDYTDSVAAGKVDKESGKGLSANDFTDAASTTVSRLNGAYVTGVSDTSTASSVSLGYTTINPSTGDTATTSVMLPIAAEGVSGIMDAATYGTVQTNAANIDAILSGAVSVTGLPASPTQSELTTAWQTATSLTTVINGAKITQTTKRFGLITPTQQLGTLLLTQLRLRLILLQTHQKVSFRVKQAQLV